MGLTISYRYKALNEDSYNSLAAYVTTIPATVTLHPGLLTIVISDNVNKEVGEFIDDNALSFHINPIEVHGDDVDEVIDDPTTDADTLRRIIFQMLSEKNARKSVLDDMTKQCDKAKQDCDFYRKCYLDSTEKADRVKSQIAAIAVLINSIYDK